MCYREVTTPIEKKDFVVGIYICPLCNKTVQQKLPYSVNQLPLVIRLTQNRMLHTRPVNCPRCQRKMWLSRVLNREGKLILDARQFWAITPRTDVY